MKEAEKSIGRNGKIREDLKRSGRIREDLKRSGKIQSEEYVVAFVTKKSVKEVGFFRGGLRRKIQFFMFKKRREDQHSENSSVITAISCLSVISLTENREASII